MKGATGICERKCNRLKLILEGQDDPNYDPNAAAAAAKEVRALEYLSKVLSGGFEKGIISVELKCIRTPVKTIISKSNVT